MMKKNSNKILLGKICAILFGIAFVFCTPDSVYAADSVTYLNEFGNETTCDSCTKITNDSPISSLDSGFYYVESGMTVTISDRITINGSQGDGNETKLILCDGAKLIAEKGIHVGRDNGLYIYAQSKDDSMGKLEATGSDNGAGIGGNENEKCGTVAIYGGDVTATGGEYYGAGIGGGKGGAGGNITINGGKVTAKGGYHAAGIGGGMGGATGIITINEGQVEATAQYPSVESGAGIGSGSDGINDTNDIITINGGQIKATGGANAAGIGGGKGSVNAMITINNGEIEAKGGNEAAGIGGGIDSNQDPKEIIIQGGTVTATGGNQGAGIGGGSNGNVGKIIIANGDVNATGGNWAAGIGGGYGKAGGEITIYGGKITATGGDQGAGIGGGKNGGGGDITINDGEVTVKGNGGGAGIGGGDGGDDGNITITGGTVTDKDKAVPPKEEENPSNSSSDEPKNTEKSSSGNSNNRNDSNQSSTILLQSFGGEGIDGLCTFEKQGALCVAAFNAATPAGFTEAFSFNLNLDSTGKTKVNYDKKQGKIVLNIPTQYQKQGRTFAVIGIDRFGITKIFYDNDADDKIFTTNLDIEGYAFSLIYSDSVVNQNGKKKTTTVSNNGTYVVKQGDCLSKIAETLKKSVKYLAEKNGLENIDKLYVDQILKY